jgi:methyl-accepting chemotaxis protein
MPTLKRQIPDYAANLSLGATLIVLAFVGVLSHVTTQRFLHNDALVEHTYRVQDSLQSVLSDLKDAETGQRGYLLTGDFSYLQPYIDASHAINADLAAVRALTRDNPIQQQHLDALEPIASQKMAELAQTIDLRQRDGLPAALRIVDNGTGKATMDQARTVIAAMQAE